MGFKRSAKLKAGGALMYHRETCTAIVLAAGQGRRMNSKIQKQYLEVGGRPLLFYSLLCFQESPLIQSVILVTGEDEISYCEKEIKEKYGFTKIRHVVAGGKERYDSVYRGLLACQDADYVFIHDGVRPFLTEDILKRGMEAVKKTGAAAAGMPSKDTVKIADQDCCVRETPDRRFVWTIQTPQVFDYALIRRAHEKIRRGNMEGVTDDAMVVEMALGTKVALFEGDYQNIKITTPEDLAIAEVFLEIGKK